MFAGHRRSIVALCALLGLVLTGCATTVGGTGVAATTLPTLDTAEDADYVPPTECLMTVDDVSSALEGTWTREEIGGGGCSYHSDRDAVFVVGPVDYTPEEFEPALADARRFNCDTEPVDVAGTGGGFVCTEHVDGQDNVEGNIVAQGNFWLFIILPESTDSGHAAETDALVALLGAVRQ